jgi:hypothetical protein
MGPSHHFLNDISGKPGNEGKYLMPNPTHHLRSAFGYKQIIAAFAVSATDCARSCKVSARNQRIINRLPTCTVHQQGQ